MAKDKKSASPNLSRINFSSLPLNRKAIESSLLVQRMKELDREFSRQTKQLAKITKDLTKKLTDKL